MSRRDGRVMVVGVMVVGAKVVVAMVAEVIVTMLTAIG
jgi:hypothetical protein